MQCADWSPHHADVFVCGSVNRQISMRATSSFDVVADNYLSHVEVASVCYRCVICASDGPKRGEPHLVRNTQTLQRAIYDNCVSMVITRTTTTTSNSARWCRDCGALLAIDRALARVGRRRRRRCVLLADTIVFYISISTFNACIYDCLNMFLLLVLLRCSSSLGSSPRLSTRRRADIGARERR